MDLLNLSTENESGIKNTAFLNIYLVQGENRLQLTGLGLESQIQSKYTTKNQKRFFENLLSVANKMAAGEKKTILRGSVELELLRVGSQANEELTNSIMSLLDL